MSTRLGAAEQENRLRRCANKRLDGIEPIAENRGDLPGGGIAHADLHDLRRMPSHQSPGEKVVVLRHDEEEKKVPATKSGPRVSTRRGNGGYQHDQIHRRVLSALFSIAPIGP